ncbi:DUF981 family protein [Nonomuraea sediminis]|uniref:DUF981 family protein n=1 Tax=Nonomuraea sediminis TaxID=2835864 RepID=UPI0027E09284|nr:DUF981 family protein [Nonomuraea sediminis]
MKIDWARMPTYNTIMAVAAGVALLLIVAFGRRLLRGGFMERVDGWALAFGALGAILAVTGLHMTLTWPLAGQGFPFDNIVFGEPCLAFGVLLLTAAFFLWRRGESLVGTNDRLQVVARAAAPISLFVLAMGLACFGIAAAGWTYTLFAAPPQEPISGAFAGVPLLEATFISGLYVLVGVGSVLFPFAVRAKGGWAAAVCGVCWGLAGVAFTLFGALNYFTHIGLIINTM